MGFLVLPLLGAPRTDHSQRQQVLEQQTYTGYSPRGFEHLYTKIQPTNQFSDAQEPIGLFMLMCDNIKYYLKQCSSPSHGQHCAMSGHTTKRRTKTLILRRGNRVVAGSKIMLPEDLVCSDLSFLCTNLSDHWEVGKKNQQPTRSDVRYCAFTQRINNVF